MKTTSRNITHYWSRVNLITLEQALVPMLNSCCVKSNVAT